MKNCRKCGQSTEDAANFCPICGNNLQPPPPPKTHVYDQNGKKITPDSSATDMGLVSMVLGIIAIVEPFGYVGLGCAVVGLILGVISMKKCEETGASSSAALAGVICSGIAIVSSFACIFLCSGMFCIPFCFYGCSDLMYF